MDERKPAMDKDRIEGIGHQIRGAVKHTFGRMIGDAKMAADGSAETARGKAQLAAAPVGAQVMGIDADRIKGVVHQFDGALKQGIGRVIADPELRQAGIAEQEAGRVQNAAGGARDSARDGVENVK
jgi:uncharacterized protein YjbJ (UPF0337 family)